MEDNNRSNKGPDIGDLKARLGLTKPAGPRTLVPGSAPGATPQGGAPTGPQQPARPGAPAAEAAPAAVPLPTGHGGMPIPPGLHGPGNQPVPPVAAPLRSPLPAAPVAGPGPAYDPRANPLGAMSVATMAANQRQPRFMPDDGTPAPRVGGRPIIATLLTIAIGLVGGALLGYSWSLVSADRDNYNKMITDANGITTEVKDLSGRLDTIAGALRKSAQVSPQGTPDFELIDTLKGIKLDPPSQQKIFHTNYARFENLTIEELFNYYNDTVALYEQIKRHVTQSEKEKAFLVKAAEDAKTREVNYGVVVEPGSTLAKAKLVQIVGNVCKNGKGDCEKLEELEGFRVAYSAGGTPFSAKLSGTGIHVLPLERTQMLDQMVAGAGPEAMAEAEYKRRLGRIRLLVEKLLITQPQLLEHLSAVTKKSKL